MPVAVKVDVKIGNYRDIIKTAADATAHAIRERSRADTAAAGFERWSKRLTVPVKRIHGGYIIQVQQKPGFMKVYEFGGISRGKPLLWIPVQGRRQKINKYRGKTLVRPRGSSVLIGPNRKVMYVGIASVTHRKRLHLAAIAKEEANKFAEKMRPLMR